MERNNNDLGMKERGRECNFSVGAEVGGVTAAIGYTEKRRRSDSGHAARSQGPQACPAHFASLLGSHPERAGRPGPGPGPALLGGCSGGFQETGKGEGRDYRSTCIRLFDKRSLHTYYVPAHARCQGDGEQSKTHPNPSELWRRFQPRELINKRKGVALLRATGALGYLVL